MTNNLPTYKATFYSNFNESLSKIANCLSKIPVLSSKIAAQLSKMVLTHYIDLKLKIITIRLKNVWLAAIGEIPATDGEEIGGERDGEIHTT